MAHRRHIALGASLVVLAISGPVACPRRPGLRWSVGRQHRWLPGLQRQCHNARRWSDAVEQRRMSRRLWRLGPGPTARAVLRHRAERRLVGERQSERSQRQRSRRGRRERCLGRFELCFSEQHELRRVVGVELRLHEPEREPVAIEQLRLPRRLRRLRSGSGDAPGRIDVPGRHLGGERASERRQRQRAGLDRRRQRVGWLELCFAEQQEHRHVVGLEHRVDQPRCQPVAVEQLRLPRRLRWLRSGAGAGPDGQHRAVLELVRRR
jgi:hypothetical protein